MSKKKYLLITGGTGGHVIPAVNFGNFLQAKGHECIIVVDHRGSKYINFFKGKIKTIYSSHISKGFFKNFFAFLFLFFGFLQSLKHLTLFRPSIVICFGSYATFSALPILIFYRILNFSKIFIHEQNSVMGKVNRLYSPFVNKIFLNFKETYKINKNYKNKTYIIGFPRNDFIVYKNREMGKDIKKNTKILICGGSQGAVNLNLKIIEIFKKFPVNILRNMHVSIQCQKEQKSYLEKILKSLDIDSEIVLYYDNFTNKLQKTDLLISRAGAGTINDIVFTQIPTIFVPFPYAADDHQITNAEFLVKENAAKIILEDDLLLNYNVNEIKNLIVLSSEREILIQNLKKIKNNKSNDLLYEHTL